MVNVLFVCLGNICRSPTAEGVFRHMVAQADLADRIAVDSAGTAGYHIGEPPDLRAQAAARRRGIDLSGLRGRQAIPDDFRRFHYVLAMDRDNHRDLCRLCPTGADDRLRLFLEFAPHPTLQDVPDPFYGDADGFERVLDLIEGASRGLLDYIRRTDLSSGTS